MWSNKATSLLLLVISFGAYGAAPYASPNSAKMAHNSGGYSKPSRLDIESAKERQKLRSRLFHGTKPRTGAFADDAGILLNIKPGSSTMPDVAGALGKTQEIVTGEAATLEVSACYRGNDGTAIVFTSDEMSPGIGGLEVYASQKAAGRSKCSISANVNGAVKTKDGISLSLTRTSIHEKLGMPSNDFGSYEAYSRKSHLPENCQRNSYYIIEYYKDRVVSFQFGTHDSC